MIIASLPFIYNSDSPPFSFFFPSSFFGNVAPQPNAGLEGICLEVYMHQTILKDSRCEDEVICKREYL